MHRTSRAWKSTWTAGWDKSESSSCPDIGAARVRPWFLPSDGLPGSREGIATIRRKVHSITTPIEERSSFRNKPCNKEFAFLLNYSPAACTLSGDDSAVDKGHAGTENCRRQDPTPLLRCARGVSIHRPEHGFVAWLLHGDCGCVGASIRF
jgi:hypothetical protein